MSHSSIDEPEKAELDREYGEKYLVEQQEDALESPQSPSSPHDDVEKRDPDEVDGGELAPSVSKPSINNIKSVPNGGFTAWLQVVGTFFMFFNTWGIINAFGAYQTFYESDLLSSYSPSDISWIGSFEAFILLFAGFVAGPIYDKGYVHHLLLGGSFLIVLGIMMTGLCTEYYQVFLAQGVAVGLGTGCIFVGGVAILSTYFSTKLATATGIAAAGSSIGGMLYPIIFNRLQPRIGFPWATRVLGFIALATLAVSNLVLRVRVTPAARRAFLDLPAWKELPYLFFNLGSFFAFAGLYAPFFYIQSYCIETHIMSPNLAFYTLAVVNATSTFGRIIPNYIADKIGPLNVLLPCALVCGILQFCLTQAHTTASVMIILCFYGFFAGTLVSLPATIYVHLAGPKNRSRIGTRMGMGFGFVAFGILLGTPVTGAILVASSFKFVWIWGGTTMCIGSIFTALARQTQSKWALWVKV